MMRIPLPFTLVVAFSLFACSPEEQPVPKGGPAETGSPERVSNVPPLDEKNIVKLAMNSKDHTTLVAAIQAADYVTSVAASGPFTVFAPTNAAFDGLPDGTLDTLLEPENKAQLRDILQYHVTTTAYPLAWLSDGQMLAMANGAKVTIGVAGEKVTVNGANVVATLPGSNGIIHVIDAVLVPPEK